MIVPCPFCGPRNHAEFSYRGDAAPRPAGVAAAEAEVANDTYLRDNLAGPMKEYWHHSQGCRAWMVVTRDTRNHAILAAEPASGVLEAARAP